MTPASGSNIHAARAASLLGWSLEGSELDTYESLDAIPGCVKDVVVQLMWRDPSVACAYLRERVPSAGPVEATVIAMKENRARRYLSFVDEEDIARVLSRELAPSELETFASFEAVSEAVELVVAKTSADGLAILAVRYLHERVPTQHRSEAMVRTEQIEHKYPHLR